MNRNTLIIPFLLVSLISSFSRIVHSTNCSISKCAGSSGSAPDIRFPFRVKSSSQQRDPCGQPGFEVWCDERSKDTLIELPRSGNFKVESIDYAAQEMWVNDPNNCLPKRLLTFNLSGSPFAGVYHQDFSFFNCSNTLNTTNNHGTNVTHLKGLVGPIKCLSGSHHFMYAIPSNGTISNHTITFLTPSNCTLIAPLVKVPVQWPPSLHHDTVSSLSSDLHDDLRLSWYMPECRPCELKGQMCALDTSSNDSEVIICSNIPNQGTLFS